MREKGKTSLHLLLASIVTMFGTLLILTILFMAWEVWMIPVILVGNTIIWCIHIGRIGSDAFYENLCSLLLMVGFFFFGVHTITLFDIPSIACMLILIFSMFNKKRLLYMTAALYIVELLYHYVILNTITPDMGAQNMIRLGLGFIVTAGSIAIARYRITRRRVSRKVYDTTLAELETAGRQNAEFLSNVSHELRTPINMVLGLSEVILEKDIPEEIRTNMLSIKLAGKRLSNQINNMLDYTEIVEGTLVPAKEPYMISSVLNDIITMTSLQNSKHQLEMVFDLNPKTPAVMVGDAEKISHVLKILLENSLKFTEEGGIYVYIGFRQEEYGVNLAIDIHDTGIGMTDSQLTQMCDDFYQANSGSNRLAGGLGLGLPIARGLLQAMGGFLYFDSKEQQGLQAHITIPQGVEDHTPSLLISHPERLCIACYFRPEKYNSDEVRKYYDNMILHMVEGLGLEGYQAHNFEGLQKLLHTHSVTHVFIAQSEYVENSSYYEDLAQRLRVVVIADHDYVLDKNSRLLIIHKPFFALSVVNLLNGELTANGFGEAQAAGRKPFSCKGVRVLAVDDEEMNLVVAKGVLGSYGIQVDTCLSGREAVELCATVPYDMVFLDHMMPGFDGIETLKRIREINGGECQDLPVVALTANTLSGAREMFRNEGFTEFIPKPIERAVLERVLRKILPDQCIQYGSGTDSDDLQKTTNSTEAMKKTSASKKVRGKKTASKKSIKAATSKTGRKEPVYEESLTENKAPDQFLLGEQSMKTRGEEAHASGGLSPQEDRKTDSTMEESPQQFHTEDMNKDAHLTKKEVPQQFHTEDIDTEELQTAQQLPSQEENPKEFPTREEVPQQSLPPKSNRKKKNRKNKGRKGGLQKSKGWESGLQENNGWDDEHLEDDSRMDGLQIADGWKDGLQGDDDQGDIGDWNDEENKEDIDYQDNDGDWDNDDQDDDGDWGDDDQDDDGDWGDDDQDDDGDWDDEDQDDQGDWDDEDQDDQDDWDDEDQDDQDDDSEEWDTWEDETPAGGSSLSFAPLSQIGVNVHLGLEYCCGEEDFYVEMLEMFCTQAIEKRAEIISLYDAANWNDYAVKVHALKSTALTIGAERLADQAKLLEQAGKKENIGYIRHDHPNLLRLYDQVCVTIEEVLMNKETGGISGC